ncbi:MAG: ABC transporter substrate-binding protein [Desulfatiglans sp.]|nr:ABC transporter substrate-binding protein [Desulfatiglans sp.]
MKMNRFACTCMVFMALVATALSPADASGKKERLTKIVLAEAVRGEGWLPVYLAQELGYFEEEGLSPQFVTYKDGPLALMGLLSGNAQFCIIGFEPVLMAFEKGQDSKVLFTTLNSQPYTFVSRPGLTRAEEFKGKVVFAGMPGSAPYYFVKTVLKKAGLNPDKDVTFASMEYGAEIVAMDQGDIDGAYVRATRLPQVEAINGNVLLDATDPEKHKQVYGSERYEAMVVQVTDEYIKKHPEIVQHFCNAVYKAMLWQAAHSDAEVASSVAPLFPGRNIDAQLISVLRRCLSPDGQFTSDGYNAVTDFCLKNGVIKTAPPMSAMVDQTFMETAKMNIH